MKRPHTALRLAKATFLAAAWLWPLLAHAQWVWTYPLATTGNDTPAALCTDHAGRPVVAAAVGGPLVLDGQALAPAGEDALLLALDQGGQVRWALLTGSPYDDGSADVAAAGDTLFWGGFFWGEASLADTTLSTPNGSKGLFVHALDSHDGHRLWSLCLRGTGQKELGAILPTAGGLYLAGYFSDTLFAGSDTLVATGTHDLFALRYDGSGQLLWASHAGLEGNVRAEVAAPMPDGGLAVGGRFRGKLAFAGDTLRSSTLDHDVFVACYDAAGQPLWARMAGGVHEARAHALCTDASGRIHLLGTFLGVLDLSDTLGIFTPGFHNDGFWLSWSATGAPLAARRLGGPDNDQLLDAVLWHDTLWVAGSFGSTLALGSFALQAADALPDGFVAAFDVHTGEVLGLQGIAGEGVVQATSLTVGPAGPFVMGRFNEAVLLDSAVATAGLYDLFVGRWLGGTPTSTATAAPTPTLKMWPNPAHERVFFDAPFGKWRLRVADLQGRLWYDGPLPGQLDIAGWPGGVYVVSFLPKGETKLLVKW